MAEEFKVITTQEQLDAIIGERVKREKEAQTKASAEYEKQIAALTAAAEESAKKYAGYDKTLAEMQAKVQGYETSSVKMRIAHEIGLPYDLANRLQGEKEEDIRQDAQALAAVLRTNNHAAPPLKGTEAPGGGGTGAAKKAELKGMLQDLRGE